MTDRIALLPDDFDSWPESAQRQFLLDGRQNYEVFLLLCDELGVERIENDRNRVRSEQLVELFMRVREQEPAQTEYPSTEVRAGGDD